VALKEARDRVGAHGLFVVGDAARLPFAEGAFKGGVALHTIHHLPRDEQVQAYEEFYRVMRKGGSGVVVNGWRTSPLMALFMPLIKLLKWSYLLYCRMRGRETVAPGDELVNKRAQTWGTFVEKSNAAWLERALDDRVPYEIRVWRSVNTGFLRALIYPRLGGRWILRRIYALEERFPHFFGRYGQYPMIVIRKEMG
jgi:SAM-dependent methyltransferase